MAVLDIFCSHIKENIPLYMQQIVTLLGERKDIDPKYAKLPSLRYAAWTTSYRLQKAMEEWECDAPPLEYVPGRRGGGQERSYALAQTAATAEATRKIASVLAQQLRMHHKQTLAWWMNLYSTEAASAPSQSAARKPLAAQAPSQTQILQR